MFFVACVNQLVVMVCILLATVSSVSTQTLGVVRPQATVARQQGGLTGFRTSLDIKHLNGSNADQPFNWDLDVSLDFDLLDLGIIRGNLFGNFETIIGGELRAVDPNQSNYIIDTSIFIRLPRGELSTAFHHVSRHQIDRPDTGSISWNMVGISYGDQLTIGQVELDVGARAMGTIQRAGVDYRGQFETYFKILRVINQKLSVIASVDGVIVPVEATFFGRNTQHGGRIEGGVRLRSKVGSFDMFVAWEQRIDASALRHQTVRWTQFGFRLNSLLP